MKTFKIISKLMSNLFKILGYIVISLLCYVFLFELDKFNEMNSNELIFISTLALVAILHKE